MILVLEPFLALAPSLRQAGFSVSPDQTMSFLEAVGVLGPKGIGDVYSAALAVYAIQPERRDEFDAIFWAIFRGQLVSADAQSDHDETDAIEPGETTIEIEAEETADPIGDDASSVERLTSRAIVSPGDTLSQLRTQARRRLPRRLSYRRQHKRRGDRIDLRRALKAAARTDGDPITLPQTRRKSRQRRIVCLIDVSGSMKDRSDGLISFAHTLVQAADRAEVFSIGTRLTRITQSLAVKDQMAALRRVGEAVSDIDGGTQIGEGLQAFLSVPRYAGFARGALVLILSDGLERNQPAAMVDATAKLSRMAWRLHWLTPLAADPGFEPKTAAMAAVLPWLDDLGNGDDAQSVAAHLLEIARFA